MAEWYVARTKAGEERKAQRQLEGMVERTLLPLARTYFRQRGCAAERISPLFPCYLFALFSLTGTAGKIRYTPGVRDLVRFGGQPARVPDWVIDQLTSRCADGPIELQQRPLAPGDAVTVRDGPFRQLEAIFDGYFSGTERVAVMLSIMNAERRVVMPSAMVTAAE